MPKPRSAEEAGVAARVVALRARHRRGLAIARRLARRLVAQGAHRVWLFGSALDPARFGSTSDVDIAVEGLGVEEVFQAYRQGLDASVPVDVLGLEQARPEIRDAIVAGGGASLPSGRSEAERRRRLAELVAFADNARLDLAFIERLAAAIPAYLAEARQGSEAALLGTVKALENVYDAFEDLAQRIETTFSAPPPQGPEWHRELLQGLGRPRNGLRPAVLSPATIRARDGYRAFRHFGRHRLYREGAAPELVAARVDGLLEAVAFLRADMTRVLDAVQGQLRSLGG